MDIILPVYQHPTLTVMIDDSVSFLDSLQLQLQQDLAYKTFSDAHLAIAWLRETHRFASTETLPIRLAYDEEHLSFEQRPIAIDFNQIYGKAMDQRRFSVPSVLIVDYAMPQMNGLEFCRAIRDLPCKKILLTGEADGAMAIEAFNQGLIDRFYKKHDNRAFQLLESEILLLQRQFFITQSRTLKDFLIHDRYAFLADPAIGALVEQLCRRFDFVEYYLFPDPAGILFFDTQGKATLMVIETDASIASHVEVAEDNGAPGELLCALRERRLVPFFSDTGGMYTDAIGSGWLTYCLPAQACDGRQIYYWALFDLPSHFLPGPLYSYAEFLRLADYRCIA